MSRRLVAGLALLLGTVSPAEEPAASADPAVRLEYRFRPGEHLDMRVAHRALSETTMNGTTQMVETMTDSTKRWTVVAVDDEGLATLEQSVDDLSLIHI